MNTASLLVSVLSALVTMAIASFAKADLQSSGTSDPADAVNTSAELAAARDSTAPANARLAILRERLRALDTRVQAMRARIKPAKGAPRLDSERLMGTVEQQRSALATRMAILDVASMGDPPDESIINELEIAYGEADKLLAVIERWYRPRRTA